MRKSRVVTLGLLLLILLILPCGCGSIGKGGKTEAESTALDGTEADSVDNTDSAPSWTDMEVEHSMELDYAEQFTVDYYHRDYALLTITETGRYLVVPEDQPVPADLEEDIVVLQQPLDHIYLVSTSVMDLFRALDGIGNVRLSGTDASDWYIEEAKEAILNGSMVYAGKYSAPDYELILSEECDLAVENTMIYHTPEVKEQLEDFGIPVLVERSSYESHPLGRVEWLKLYSVLLDKEEQAEAYFADQEEQLGEIFAQENTEKTVAFFYINSNGIVNVRKSGDYVAKMIELAGGRYIFPNLGDENALSTMNMQMETFYAEAKDADYLIYNSTIDGEIKALDELLEKSSLLADFKAVKEGNVWCTQKSMFQESTGCGTLMLDINRMLLGETEDTEFTYLYRLE